MEWLLVVSNALRLAALLSALLVLRRYHDLRIAFVALTLSVAAIHQTLVLWQRPAPTELWTGLGELLLSVMALSSVWLLSRFLSEKQRGERMLTEREAHFRSLVENSLDVIILLDPGGRIVYANPATRKVLGYEPHELLHQDGFGYLDGDDREGARALFTEAQSNPGKGYGILSRVRRKDGGLATMQVAGSVLTSAEGEHQALIEMRDVTAEWEGAAENQRLQRELHQAQKMETLGTLTGGIAHDFNNLLTPILGNAELARSQLPRESDVQPVLSRISRAAEQARDLVRRMLVFSRKSEGHEQPVEIAHVIGDTFELLRSSLPRNVQMHSEMTLERGVVLADPVELQQVLINLCTNAAHAMRDSGGRLQVRLRNLPAQSLPGRPEVIAHSGEFALLSVEDTGHGMDEAVQARIFEPFFSTKSPGEGTGLGLSIVHGIVMRLGGFIAVESRRGQGTRFEVYLPLLSNSELPSPVEMAHDDESSGRVLLVDDQPGVVEVGAELLRLRGFDVETASNAKDALDRIRSDPAGYLAVVTDYSMPGMTGLELARELRRLRPSLPVVLTTGFAEADVQQGSDAIAGLRVLSKPYTSEGLCQAIREAERAARIKAAV